MIMKTIILNGTDSLPVTVKVRRIYSKTARHDKYSRDLNGNDTMPMFSKSLTYRTLCILDADSILRTQMTNASGCLFTNEALHAVAELVLVWIFVKVKINVLSPSRFSSNNIDLILFWIDVLKHFYSIYMSSMNPKFHLSYQYKFELILPSPGEFMQDNYISRCIFFNEKV